MKTKKLILFSAACCSLTLSFTSCNKDDDNNDPVKPTTSQIYILNSGKWKSNNATLDSYDETAKVLNPKVFSAINARGLGDTANDMLIYGSKMYIAVDESNTIEITDLNAKSIKTISPKDEAGQPQSPRSFTGYAGKVYAVLFDGHLAVIDTTTMEITQKVKVGPNPYQVCATGGKLYVANSGGYNPVPDSTLSVVDPISLTEEKKIVVGVNPMSVEADSNGKLYVKCGGNFTDIKASVNQVDLSTGKSTPIYTNQNIFAKLVNDKLYVISSENDENWLPKNVKFILYDAKANKELKSNFISDGTTVKNPCSINVDPNSENIYIGTSDHTNTGDMYIFSQEGKKLNSFGVSSINPMGAYFVCK